MKFLKPVAALALVYSAAAFPTALTEPALNDDVVKTSRYSAVKNIPPIDQLNPLKVVVRTTIPQNVSTVRESVNFLLSRSGYQLADESVLSEEALTLLDLPLPEIHRKIGPMTLDQALYTLSGEAFQLVVDPVHRKVAYELSSKLMRVK